jgi:prepilin-type N-terminal cleavage/methylation domain-containing protein
MRYSLSPHNPRAFTLIELLTVIAIIGVLAAILIPTVSKVRQSAKNAQCTANLREWGRAILFYANDNKGNYTVLGRNGRWWYDAGTSPYTQYFQQTGQTATRNIRTCPLAPPASGGVTRVEYFICKGSINGTINTVAPNDKIPLLKARNPSQLLLMLDGVENGQDASFYVSSDQARITGHVMPMFNGTASGDFQESAKRHGSRTINGVFGDGSIKRITGTPAGQGDGNSIQQMRPVWFQIY